MTNAKFSSANIDSISILLGALPKFFSPEEMASVRRACEVVEPYYSSHTELTNTPLLEHALGAATILAGMNMDCASISAAILHALPEYLKDWNEKVKTEFGNDVCELVEGISRMEQIRQFSEMGNLSVSEVKKGDQAQQIETLRKMLLAMVQDIRVVLIKLAERTQTMRHLSRASAEVQKTIARETRGILAPLANRLGVWQIKWELEDLSLRYLEPQLYKQVAGLLDERRADREQYIADVLTLLRQELAQANIQADVTGRPKHIFSIINKMKRKHIEFNELYDVRAVRILVGDLRDCYTALGLIHNLWQPIPGEFDDYIAHPKSNGYRSLHTAVIGPRNLAIEVQSAQPKCTSIPNSVLPHTGATRKEENPTPSLTRRLPGCGRYWNGKKMSRITVTCWNNSRASCFKTMSTCLRLKEKFSTYRRVRHRLTFPIPCTLIWDTEHAVQKLTATSCR